MTDSNGHYASANVVGRFDPELTIILTKQSLNRRYTVVRFDFRGTLVRDWSPASRLHQVNYNYLNMHTIHDAVYTLV